MTLMVTNFFRLRKSKWKIGLYRYLGLRWCERLGSFRESWRYADGIISAIHVYWWQWWSTSKMTALICTISTFHQQPSLSTPSESVGKRREQLRWDLGSIWDKSKQTRDYDESINIVKLNDIAQAGINYLINNKKTSAIRLHALL